MKQDLADEIVSLMNRNRKIDAIRVLRMETHLDLLAAKTYVEAPSLAERLNADFVMSTNDELNKARNELKRLSNHIRQLEEMEGLEHEEATAERVAYMAMTKQEIVWAHGALGFMADVAEPEDEGFYLNPEQRVQARTLRDRLYARWRLL